MVWFGCVYAAISSRALPVVFGKSRDLLYCVWQRGWIWKHKCWIHILSPTTMFIEGTGNHQPIIFCCRTKFYLEIIILKRWDHFKCWIYFSLRNSIVLFWFPWQLWKRNILKCILFNESAGEFLHIWCPQDISRWSIKKIKKISRCKREDFFSPANSWNVRRGSGPGQFLVYLVGRRLPSLKITLANTSLFTNSTFGLIYFHLQISWAKVQKERGGDGDNEHLNRTWRGRESRVRDPTRVSNSQVVAKLRSSSLRDYYSCTEACPSLFSDRLSPASPT